MYDLIVIGAGPCGLSCAIAAQDAGLNCLTLEAGVLTDTIYHYPTHMRFFSSPELLEIGHIPFIIDQEKPSREQALNYYRQVVMRKKPTIHFREKATRLERTSDGFRVHTDREVYRAKHVVVATGYYQTPNLIHVPGEQLPHVHHYYRDGHPYFGLPVVVVGGSNSAVDAALDLQRSGADVTVIYRGADVSDKVKPWVLPTYQSRVRSGAIKTRYSSHVQKITEHEVFITNTDNETERIPAAAVFIMTGYRPDHSLIKELGVMINPETGEPVHDPVTMETNIPGLYIAGVIAAGYDANRIFIENGRWHGPNIVESILAKSNYHNRS